MPKAPKLDSPQSLTAVLAEKPPPQPVPPPPPPNPLNRKTFIPKNVHLSIPNQKSLQVFNELKSLNIEKFPVGGAVLMRSFVEATAEVFCAQNSIVIIHQAGKNQGKAFSLGEKVEATLQALGPAISKPDAAAVRIALTSRDSVISIGRLNEYVHNPAVFPSRTDLIASWSGIEPFFKAIWK